MWCMSPRSKLQTSIDHERRSGQRVKPWTVPYALEVRAPIKGIHRLGRIIHKLITSICALTATSRTTWTCNWCLDQRKRQQSYHHGQVSVPFFHVDDESPPHHGALWQLGHKKNDRHKLLTVRRPEVSLGNLSRRCQTFEQLKDANLSGTHGAPNSGTSPTPRRFFVLSDPLRITWQSPCVVVGTHGQHQVANHIAERPRDHGQPRT